MNAISIDGTIRTDPAPTRHYGSKCTDFVLGYPDGLGDGRIVVSLCGKLHGWDVTRGDRVRIYGRLTYHATAGVRIQARKLIPLTQGGAGTNELD